MENYNLIELSYSDLKEIEGGNFILYALGYLFVQSGNMAVNGAAGHEVMGFK